MNVTRRAFLKLAAALGLVAPVAAAEAGFLRGARVTAVEDFVRTLAPVTTGDVMAAFDLGNEEAVSLLNKLDIEACHWTLPDGTLLLLRWWTVPGGRLPSRSVPLYQDTEGRVRSLVPPAWEYPFPRRIN